MLVLLSSGVAGCATATWGRWYSNHFLPGSAAEIAETGLTVTTVAPWLDYLTPLHTDFPLTSKEALAQAIPQTATFVGKLLDVKTLQVELALQQSLLNATNTTTTETGKEPTSKGTTTETDQPGTLPSPAQTAVDISKLSASVLPSATLPTVATDPFLLYRTATALMQEVAALSREVEDAALAHDCDAYLVRMSANVMPTRRALPFDTYIDVGLADETRCNRLMPLLVTDEVTSASEQQTRQGVRQLSASLAFLSTAAGGLVGAGSLSDALNQGANFELNSVLMVGQGATPGSLRVRIGAQKKADGTYDMVARTYKVTAVLLVPKRADGKPTDLVTVQTQVRYRNHYDGEEFVRFAGSDRPKIALSLPRSGNFVKDDCIGELCLANAKLNLVVDEARPAVVNVPNAVRTWGPDLMAYLNFKSGLQIPAVSVEAVDASKNRALAVTFPSWTALGPQKQAGTPPAPPPPIASFNDLLSDPDKQLCIRRRQRPWSASPDIAVGDPDCFHLVAIRTPLPVPPKKPTYDGKVLLTVSSIVADEKGTGSVVAYVKLPKASDPAKPPKADISVVGAQVSSAKGAAGNEIKAQISDTGAVVWRLDQTDQVTLTLSQLIPGATVQVGQGEEAVKLTVVSLEPKDPPAKEKK